MLLKLTPERVGALEQRHVRRVLVVGEPDDSVDAVRGAHAVRDVEALQPEYALASLRKLVDGGAAHPAHPDDDDVIPPRLSHSRPPDQCRKMLRERIADP